MNKKFAVIVLDSFGVGYMDDCKCVRPSDVGANTALHIFERENLYLETLEKLGIMNATGKETGKMKFSKDANFTTANLAHYGADTFFGHQEIMGTKPEKPRTQRLSEHIDETMADLNANGFATKKYNVGGVDILTVDDAMVIADNMETDLGGAINVSGTFDKCTFEEVKKVGEIVRKHYAVPRIIALGGEDVPFENILATLFQKDGFAGIDTPKSGLYIKGYLVVHIGFGVDTDVQLPNALNKVGTNTHLYGKVADIVISPYAKYTYGVDTATLFSAFLADFEREESGFFCLNVQETDLAGHRCDASGYANVLKIADKEIAKIMKIMNKDDVLIVMADHGNDPYSGNSAHTRERVPILLYGKNLLKISTETRNTLADVGATVAKYFDTTIKNGTPIF